MSKQWNQNIQFPIDSDYVVRIMDATFGNSKSSGNPMITIETEVVSPGEKEVAGEMVTVAGVKPDNMYLVTKNIKKPDETKSLDGTKERLLLMLPGEKALIDSIDADNVQQEIIDKLKGLSLYCVMYADTKERRKAPTAAELAEAAEKNVQAEGEIMKNPLTGENLVTYRPKVGQVFGPVPSKP